MRAAAKIESTNRVASVGKFGLTLRAAMNRPLPATHIAAAFGETCARWRDRRFGARRETVTALAAAWGWSEPLLDESIDALLAPFSDAALADFARHAPHKSRLVGVILPGNIPGAGIHEIATGLIAGCALMVKTATAEPIFFARFAQTLRETDAEAGARIAVINWSRQYRELTAVFRSSCDWIAAFGGDETIAALASNPQFALEDDNRDSLADRGAGRIAAAFGDRVSGVLVAAEIAAKASIAQAIARDVSLFEQRGCLSPRHIFVESSDGVAACEFARELAAALERTTVQLPPPRRLGIEEAAAVRRMRETARWRGIGGHPVVMWEGDGLGWTVICDNAAMFTPSPGYRTVTVSSIGSMEELRRRLEPVAGRIEAFAVAAPAERRERLNSFLQALGITYVCEPGEMQSPPIDWSHGGGRYLRALAGSP